jgi:serine/threonine protein kinase
MKLLEPGAELDGFTIEECIHSGGMAHIYRVGYTDAKQVAGFPMAMKIPRMTAGDGAENIVSFEIESQIMQVLTGTHVPRFVAAGDLERVPYLVMEYIQGHTLQHWLDISPDLAPTRLRAWVPPWPTRPTPCTAKTRCILT